MMGINPISFDAFPGQTCIFFGHCKAAKSLCMWTYAMDTYSKALLRGWHQEMMGFYQTYGKQWNVSY